MSGVTEDIMLDLETMGNGPRAAIRAIGAVYFTRTEVLAHRSFYVRVDLQSCVRAGMEIDVDTILWWLGQSEEARREMRAPDGVHLGQVLQSFSEFVGVRSDLSDREVRIWGNGAAFDNVILASAYKAMDLSPPWKFYNDRCYRTVKALYPEVKIPRTGTHHNALNDAVSQAAHLVEIWKTGGAL